MTWFGRRRRKTVDGSRRPITDSSRPAVSFVLGSYNRIAYLRATIDSIRIHDIPVPYEIVVVDGGSNDGALDWLTAQKDILTIVQHNRGEWLGKPVRRRSWGYFMNLAFKAAQGELLLMVSDDCLLVPGSVRSALERYRALQQEGRRLGGVAFYFRDWPDEPRFYVQLTLGGNMMVNHGFLVREALEAVRWADEDRYVFYKADSDLCLRLWQAGFEIVDAPGAFVEHHGHANESVRATNNAVLEHDRRAYIERWDGIYYHRHRPDLRRKVFCDFVDPHDTARIFASLDARVPSSR
jgi:GT2 family glycosyltransferase